MTYALTNDEQSALSHTFTVRRPGVLDIDTRPNVLYRIVCTPAGNVYAQRMDTPRRITVQRRDADDEPWGDPVGLGMPRHRLTLLGALWHIVTAKYRRVI